MKMIYSALLGNIDAIRDNVNGLVRWPFAEFSGLSDKFKRANKETSKPQ